MFETGFFGGNERTWHGWCHACLTWDDDVMSPTGYAFTMTSCPLCVVGVRMLVDNNTFLFKPILLLKIFSSTLSRVSQAPLEPPGRFLV